MQLIESVEENCSHTYAQSELVTHIHTPHRLADCGNFLSCIFISLVCVWSSNSTQHRTPANSQPLLSGCHVPKSNYAKALSRTPLGVNQAREGRGEEGAKGARACQSFSQLVIMAQNPISKCWVHWLRTRGVTDDDMNSTGWGAEGGTCSCHCYSCCTWVATVYGLARSVCALKFELLMELWWISRGSVAGACLITRISMATSSDKLSEKCQHHMDNRTAHKAQTNSLTTVIREGGERRRKVYPIDPANNRL